MMRRVRRPAQHDELLRRLVGDDGPFSTLAEALTFAAGLGFSEGRRQPFARTGEQIDFDVFVRLGVEGLVDMIAAAAHDDVAILGPAGADERLTVFEEYANGGLESLQGRLARSKADLESLLSVVLDVEHDTAAEQPDGGVDFDAVVDELTR